METRPAPLELFEVTQQQGLQHKVLSVPELTTLVRATMPELLSQAEHSTTIVLDQIYRYLFVQKTLRAPKLQQQLTPELYTALYGLKSMIKDHGVPRTLMMLEEHKRRFGEFLKEEMED